MEPRATTRNDRDSLEYNRRRVMFINRSYWPDGEATGQLLTELAEDLTESFDVSVIAGRPNANPAGEPYRLLRGQTRNGVRIRRVPHSRLPKHSLVSRAINFITFVLAGLGRGIAIPRQDLIVIESDPFLMALFADLFRWRHRAKIIIYLQDIHPDLGIAIGRIRDNLPLRLLRKALHRAYRKADRVIVPSEDMRQTLLSFGVPEEACMTIPNWIDTARVRPSTSAGGFRRREGIEPDRFVVMYSGNLGVTQRLESLLDAADRLRHDSRLLFVFVGEGTAEPRLRRITTERQLPNTRYFPYQPKERLGESLSAADLHVISVHPKALPFLMPSKLYGILAAGRPVLAAIHPKSEMARLILDEDLGTVVSPDNVDELVAAIQDALASEKSLTEQGGRARQLAESEYDRRVVTHRFARLIDSLLNEPEHAPSVAA